ncbi:unnamed protein product [Prorocentrum cordatum]|uniref:Uncharacterized protein n=1 Tax=Prorocentrum cordatum TaxID=2364126 RepID=A0ABN9V599_9DINO|nr:unnamed protein product [Polarella glacialis]
MGWQRALDAQWLPLLEPGLARQVLGPRCKRATAGQGDRPGSPALAAQAQGPRRMPGGAAAGPPNPLPGVRGCRGRVPGLLHQRRQGQRRGRRGAGQPFAI